jgi:hypothetical protein
MSSLTVAEFAGYAGLTDSPSNLRGTVRKTSRSIKDLFIPGVAAYFVIKSGILFLRLYKTDLT